MQLPMEKLTMKNGKVGVIVLVALVWVSLVPTSAFAWWTGAQTISEIYAGYTDGSLAITMPGTTCGVGIASFSTANSDPAKVESIAIAAFLSGKKLNCAILNCDASGYAVAKQCRIVN